MQLGNTRVWDYVGDNFVHRLLQNNEDGKLVEVEGNVNSRRQQSGKSLNPFLCLNNFLTSKLAAIGKGDNMAHDEKLDSVQLEYLYLLQNQLASQKIHFEGIIDRLEQQHRQEVLLHIFCSSNAHLKISLFQFSEKRLKKRLKLH